MRARFALVPGLSLSYQDRISRTLRVSFIGGPLAGHSRRRNGVAPDRRSQ
jgi:hypothetical protein